MNSAKLKHKHIKICIKWIWYILHLCTTIKQFRKKIKKTTLLIITSQRIKFLEINLETQPCEKPQSTAERNCKGKLVERHPHAQGLEDNTMKTHLILKATQRSKDSYQNPNTIFGRNSKDHLKIHVEPQRIPHSQHNTEKEQGSWRPHTFSEPSQGNKAVTSKAMCTGIRTDIQSKLTQYNQVIYDKVARLHKWENIVLSL